jgi:hypothetical protein
MWLVLKCLGETEDAWLFSDLSAEGPVQHLALSKDCYPTRPEVITIRIQVLGDPEGEGDAGG